jgi:hypothetical protein
MTPRPLRATARSSRPPVEPVVTVNAVSMATDLRRHDGNLDPSRFDAGPYQLDLSYADGVDGEDPNGNPAASLDLAARDGPLDQQRGAFAFHDIVVQRVTLTTRSDQGERRYRHDSQEISDRGRLRPVLLRCHAHSRFGEQFFRQPGCDER